MSGFQANDRDDFELSQTIGTYVSHEPIQTASKFNNPANRDEKALTGTGQYQFEDLEEDFDEYDEAEQDAAELNEVVDVYAEALKKPPTQHDDQPVGKFFLTVGSSSFEAKNKATFLKQKEELKSLIGEHQFNEIYELLKYHRQKDTDEEEVQSQIKYMTNNNKQLKSIAFQIDCLIVKEMQS